MAWIIKAIGLAQCFNDLDNGAVFVNDHHLDVGDPPSIAWMKLGPTKFDWRLIDWSDDYIVPTPGVRDPFNRPLSPETRNLYPVLLRWEP